MPPKSLKDKKKNTSQTKKKKKKVLVEAENEASLISTSVEESKIVAKTKIETVKKKKQKKANSEILKSSESLNDIHEVTVSKVSVQEVANTSLVKTPFSQSKRKKASENKVPKNKKKKKRLPDDSKTPLHENSAISTEKISDSESTEISTVQISDDEIQEVTEISTVQISDEEQNGPDPNSSGAIKISFVEETADSSSDDDVTDIAIPDNMQTNSISVDVESGLQMTETNFAAESEKEHKVLIGIPALNQVPASADAIPLIGEAPRKRPAASDFMNDPKGDQSQGTSSESSKRTKRDMVADMKDEDKTHEIIFSAAPNKKADETSTEISKEVKAEPILKEEELDEEESEGTEQEPETDPLRGGAPFLGYENFDTYSNTLLPQVVKFLKVTKKLPSSKDEYDFYQSYPSFMAFSKNQGQRVLQLIGKMFKHHHVYQAWKALPSTTVTGVEEQTEAVVEANDTLLERVDKIIDMLKQDKNENKLEIQQKTSKNVLVAAWNTNSGSQQNKPIRLLHSKNILRPQLKWAVRPDNSDTPFLPLIRNKPNAKVPLQEIYKSLLEGGSECGISAFIRSVRGDQTTEYPHPYEYELETLEVRPWQLQLGSKQEPKEVADTPLTIIDKVEQVPGLVKKLEAVREIAIDLEAHSYRSYLGFTCLMQLSTRTEDFIVDTLTLRTDLLPLNKVFTNPDIVKVLHGAKGDILWLQRDLGLYVVNMFDSFHACKQLGLPRCSLSYLLSRYCDVTADKQYQLADWRIRPLPDVMIKYAREDTHYLLYIYDCLRNELLHQGSHTLESVYRNSKAECEQVFRKPVFTEDSYSAVYAKTKIPFQPQQKECLKLIFKWRDHTARNEDESTAFVLPNHMMFKIAELLPGDQEGILGCCNPPPPLVRLHVQELSQIVEKARHYNPLLDPANTSVNEEEYTPGFLDTTHQHSVESMFIPKPTPARRIKERKEIFYVPKSGPDVQIKSHSTTEPDSISLTSDTGTISESVSSQHFFDVATVKSDIADAVKAVKDSMSAPFQQFMSKIEQLRKEEEEKKNEAPTVVYPIKDELPPEDEDEEDKNVIIFSTKNKRPLADQTNELRATTKRHKKTVGDVTAFNYEEITMSKLAQNEEVRPPSVGDMLNKGEDSRAQSIRKRTTMKSGNKSSSFQNFLKSKFKR